MRRSIAGRLVFASATLGLVALTSAVHAQTRVPRSLRYEFGSVGLVRGQSIRVTIVNLVEPPDPDAPPNPEIDPCWRVMLVDAEGRSVADSGDLELPPGRTRTFSVDRATLRRDEGPEERAGRIRLRAVVMVENDNELVEPPEPDRLRLSVEILASRTGRTTFALFDPPAPIRVQ
jgi:hypothetical protein